MTFKPSRYYAPFKRHVPTMQTHCYRSKMKLIKTFPKYDTLCNYNVFCTKLTQTNLKRLNRKWRACKQEVDPLLTVITISKRPFTI